MKIDLAIYGKRTCNGFAKGNYAVSRPVVLIDQRIDRDRHQVARLKILESGNATYWQLSRLRIAFAAIA
jgi:hypothetical protein